MQPKEITDIKDLKPDPRNANRGTQRGRGMLENSLRNYGAGRSILADKNGVVIAGNKVMEVAGQIDLRVREVRTNGHELVVVRRMDLDMEKDKAAKELAIADNRIGQVDLDFDPDILKKLSTEIDLGQFWMEDELSKLLMNDTQGDKDVAPQSLTEKYMIIVDCINEQQQIDLLDRFTAEGLTCRALVS